MNVLMRGVKCGFAVSQDLYNFLGVILLLPTDL